MGMYLKSNSRRNNVVQAHESQTRKRKGKEQMRKISQLVWAAALIGGVVGCETQRPSGTRYVDPGAVVPGAAGQVTMYDLESSAQLLVQQMLGSKVFVRNYEEAKVAKARGANGKTGDILPLVVIGNIENKTGDRIQNRLDAIGETVRGSLLSSGLFELKDDEANDALVGRILRGPDGGLEGGALLQTMGKHECPNFIVLGDFRHFEDVGGYHTYRLRLAILNIWTGQIVWEGIQSRVKL